MRAAVVIAVLLAAAPSSAQVAVTLVTSADDVAQRDVAATIVQGVRERWQLLSPQLGARAHACAVGDTACLRDIAARAEASHLLVLRLAPLGVRDQVVAVQLFDVKSPTALFEESIVHAGKDEARAAVRELVARLVAVPGPPPALAQQPPPPPSASPSEPGLLTWSGYALLGAAALGTAGVGAVGAVLVNQDELDTASNVLFWGFVGTGVLAAAGTAAFVVDAL